MELSDLQTTRECWYMKWSFQHHIFKQKSIIINLYTYILYAYIPSTLQTLLQLVYNACMFCSGFMFHFELHIKSKSDIVLIWLVSTVLAIQPIECFFFCYATWVMLPLHNHSNMILSLAESLVSHLWFTTYIVELQIEHVTTKEWRKITPHNNNKHVQAIKLRCPSWLPYVHTYNVQRICIGQMHVINTKTHWLKCFQTLHWAQAVIVYCSSIDCFC